MALGVNLDQSRAKVIVDEKRLRLGFIVRGCSGYNRVPFLVMKINPDPGSG